MFSGVAKWPSIRDELHRPQAPSGRFHFPAEHRVAGRSFARVALGFSRSGYSSSFPLNRSHSVSRSHSGQQSPLRSWCGGWNWYVGLVALELLAVGSYCFLRFSLRHNGNFGLNAHDISSGFQAASAMMPDWQAATYYIVPVITSALAYAAARLHKRNDQYQAAQQALIESGPEIIKAQNEQLRARDERISELYVEIDSLWKAVREANKREEDCLRRLARLENQDEV